MAEQPTQMRGNAISLAQTERIYISPYLQEDVSTHSHHFFELAYVTGGSALHTLNGEARRIARGDCFVMDYGSTHSYAQSRGFTLINCLFLPELVDDTLRGCRSFDALLRHCLIRYYTPTRQQTPANRVFHDADGAVLALLERMLAEYTGQKPGCQEVLRCQLTELMIHLTRFVVREQENHPTSGVVQEILGYIRAGYAGPLTLGGFCRSRHFSLQYLSRRFKKETGATFQEALQQARVGQSCRLLAGSALPVAEVARAVGYENVKFFGQVFKRLVGMPPREYRRQFSGPGLG